MLDISKKINAFSHDGRRSEPAGDKRSSGHQMDVRAGDAAYNLLGRCQFPSSEARRIWRPDNYQDLWAAAGFKLRVLSEVWEAVTSTPFQSFPASKTVDDSILVIARQG